MSARFRGYRRGASDRITSELAPVDRSTLAGIRDLHTCGHGHLLQVGNGALIAGGRRAIFAFIGRRWRVRC
jgi:hypothetical protein